MTAAGLLATDKCKDAFKHVVTTVFGLPMDHNIRKAFVYDIGSEDLLDIYRLTGMTLINVTELDFRPNEWAKTTVPLPKGLRSNITVFQAMYQECQKKNDKAPEKIITFTFDDFNKFREEHQTQQAEQPVNQLPPPVMPYPGYHLSILWQNSRMASNVILPPFRQSRILTSGIPGKGHLLPPQRLRVSKMF